MEPLRVRVVETGLYVDECRTRLPFKFGTASMSWAPMLTARVLVEDAGGRREAGFSADLMVPKWFDKDPARDYARNVADLIASARAAAAAVLNAETNTLFNLWRGAAAPTAGARNAAPAAPPNRLVEGFGAALIERALMDAACRIAGISFFEALRADLFGLDPAALHPELDGWHPARSLPPAPSSAVLVRHTIGLSDFLRVHEIPASQRVRDGLPQALDEVIGDYGVSRFKVKLSGEPDRDLDRLMRVDQVLTEFCDAAGVTLDANEQFTQPGALPWLLSRLESSSRGRRFLKRITYIEQPFPREDSFDSSRAEEIGVVTAFAPVIIDEADDSTEAFPRALECGYRGVSVKNCKGVFRTLINRGLCELYTRTRGREHFQSAEDLTNLPVLALQQDLATVAALGLPDAERNGHHYFTGLNHLPVQEAQAARCAHPDLYAEHGETTVVRIEAGRMNIGSLQCRGYGYDVPIRVEGRTPADDWRFPAS